MPLDDYMTTREAAVALNTTPAKVTRSAQRGKLEGAVKKDWFWMVPKATVDKLLSQKVKQAA